MANHAKSKSYVLRCYIKQVASGEYVGVCLRPNLVVQARSEREAKHRLQELIKAYVKDAIRDGALDHFMSQRAPVRFYLEYCTGWLQAVLRSMKFVHFTETCPVRRYA